MPRPYQKEAGVKVRILVAGKYNGENLRSRQCQEGDVLETKEWYAEKLTAMGLAEPVEEETLQPKRPARARKTPAVKATGKPVERNVFLE